MYSKNRNLCIWYMPQTMENVQHNISLQIMNQPHLQTFGQSTELTYILIFWDPNILHAQETCKSWIINTPLSIWNDEAYVRVSPIYITDVATISHIAGGSSTSGLNERFPFRSFISSCDPSCRKHQVAFRGVTDFI